MLTDSFLTRRNTIALEERRNILNEKLARRERKKNKKKRRDSKNCISADELTPDSGSRQAAACVCCALLSPPIWISMQLLFLTNPNLFVYIQKKWTQFSGIEYFNVRSFYTKWNLQTLKEHHLSLHFNVYKPFELIFYFQTSTEN